MITQLIIGANSFIKTGFDGPARHLAAGSPAKGTRTYQQLAHRCRNGLQPATPRTEPMPSNITDRPETDGGWQHVTLSQHRADTNDGPTPSV
jgi:hypothetical protein